MANQHVTCAKIAQFLRAQADQLEPKGKLFDPILRSSGKIVLTQGPEDEEGDTVPQIVLVFLFDEDAAVNAGRLAALESAFPDGE
jgi:hypothetical protein